MHMTIDTREFSGAQLDDATSLCWSLIGGGVQFACMPNRADSGCVISYVANPDPRADGVKFDSSALQVETQ